MDCALEHTTLIAGVPRSGTTLLTALLGDCPNTIAMAEPIAATLGPEPERAVEQIESFCIAARATALTQRTYLTRAQDGQVLTNFVTEPQAEAGIRSEVDYPLVALPIDKPLSHDFRLFVKHPSAFSALAPWLVARIPLVACVRHPLALLASWQTVPFPVQQGRIPAAERFDRVLRERLESTSDRLTRQVEILRRIFDVFAALPGVGIVRYEDLVQDPIAVVRRLSGAKPDSMDRHVYRQTPRERYRDVNFAELARALIPAADAFRPFYPEIDHDLRGSSTSTGMPLGSSTNAIARDPPGDL